ncbi:tripartite tricarboxylate transporter permease [Methanosarcina sp.]|uniref:tripartite tricarboxylate transporter permease n=1 Tax=Methanosarcina sp. TaxID=2213 RepID=UPI002ABBF49C|nr:tripartite tricarboxylate transporter permease [Methanosarcina sp.]MDY9927122.1 tripartite tricarboxylate transporter permease [Methanosarcina sp.]
MEEVSLFLLLFSVLAGYLLGIFSGLLPGIHTNNFALALVALAPFLADRGIAPFYIALIILSNAVSHTFHDIIPSVFLGAPDGDTALAVLPGHRLLMEGAGAEAVRLSALGSAGSVVASMLFVLPFSLFFGAIYPYLQDYMAWVLLTIVFIMLASEKSDEVKGQGSLAKYRCKLLALFLFLITGALGLFAFSRESLLVPVISFGQASVLLPLLSGLFGASQLIISLLTSSEIPAESVSRFELSRKRILRGVFTGSTAGSLVAWLPGVSSAIAALLAGLFVKSDFDRRSIQKETSEPVLGGQKSSLFSDPYADRQTLESSKEFIVSVSGVNTSNAIFGLVALLVIGKTRSGAMAAVNEILGIGSLGFQVILLFFAAILLTAMFSYFSTVWIGNNAHHMLRKLDYAKLCTCVLAGLAITVFLFTGLFGLFLFIISTPIGMLPSFMKVRKSHAMGVILLPVILYFL